MANNKKRKVEKSVIFDAVNEYFRNACRFGQPEKIIDSYNTGMISQKLVKDMIFNWHDKKKTVLTLIDHCNYSVNSVDDFKQTIIFDKLQFLDELIYRGIDLNVRDRNWYNCLEYWIQSKFINIEKEVKIVIENGIDFFGAYDYLKYYNESGNFFVDERESVNKVKKIISDAVYEKLSELLKLKLIDDLVYLVIEFFMFVEYQ